MRTTERSTRPKRGAQCLGIEEARAPRSFAVVSHSGYIGVSQWCHIQATSEYNQSFWAGSLAMRSFCASFDMRLTMRPVPWTNDKPPVRTSIDRFVGHPPMPGMDARGVDSSQSMRRVVAPPSHTATGCAAVRTGFGRLAATAVATSTATACGALGAAGVGGSRFFVRGERRHHKALAVDGALQCVQLG